MIMGVSKGIVRVLFGYFQKLGDFTPKMDGENNGSKPYFLMDDLGGRPTPIFGLTPIFQPLLYLKKTCPWPRLQDSDLSRLMVEFDTGWGGPGIFRFLDGL